MKAIANVCGYLWFAALFLALAATTAGCPLHRYIWSAQFVLLGVMMLSIGAAVSAAKPAPKQGDG
jgi:peptidoglycan/LPS O-acetylase OafA/YrhL